MISRRHLQSLCHHRYDHLREVLNYWRRSYGAMSAMLRAPRLILRTGFGPLALAIWNHSGFFTGVIAKFLLIERKLTLEPEETL